MSSDLKSSSSNSASSSIAKPPAAPPPPPPAHQNNNPDDASRNNSNNSHDDDTHRMSEPLLPGSYQYSTFAGRAAAHPTIIHYDEGGNNEDPRTFFVVRGDASLRPNTGQTNSYDIAIFGLALHELLEHIRLANIISSVASITLLLVSWVWKLLMGQIARLVLSCYLAFLSFLLLLVELIGIWNVSSVDSFLKQNFGLLRHPIGRAIYIVLLCTLCFSIGGWFYFVVGGLYLATAAVLLYAWTIYPELRRPFEVDDDAYESVDGTNQSDDASRSVTWSDYASSFTSYVKTSSETAALLGSSFQKGSFSKV